MTRFFRVTPAAVHQMPFKLEPLERISCKTGLPRSVAITIERPALPDPKPPRIQPVKTNVTRR